MTEINAGLVYLVDFALSLLFGILMWRRARRRTDLYMARWERLSIGETSYLYEVVEGDHIGGHAIGIYEDEKKARSVARRHEAFGRGMMVGIRKVAVHRPPKAEDTE